MTETKDIAALRPSERAKLGFVTDDNTGGYYVAECEECGKIFPSQTCDGGGAIADTGDYGDCYCPHCGHVDPNECDNANHVWNVQQLIIINLTSQLGAERQRADDLVKIDGRREEHTRWVEKRLADTEAELAALKAKLANPVVLPTRRNAGFFSDEEFSNKDLAAIYNCAILEIKKKIQTAGFTTVKDES